MILSLWLSITMIPATAVGNSLLVQTNNFHNSEKLDYAGKSTSNTLNLYRIISADKKSQSKLLYHPLNMYFPKNGINRLSIKQKRLLRKAAFYKDRRSKKYKRILKKLDFYKKRRRNKFKRNQYLLRWFQNSAKVTL